MHDYTSMGSATHSIFRAIRCLADSLTMREVDQCESTPTSLVESGEERSTIRRGAPRWAGEEEARERTTSAPPVLRTKEEQYDARAQE
jgi:hypothetical protein